MNHAERDSSSQISDEDRGSAASKSEHRCDRVERGASLLEELRIMLDREDNQTPQPEQNVKEVDPSRRQFRFERGPSLLLDVQREMQSEPLQAPENAENGAIAGQAEADKRRAFAFRPGMHLMAVGDVLNGGDPNIRLQRNPQVQPKLVAVRTHIKPRESFSDVTQLTLSFFNLNRALSTPSLPTSSIPCSLSSLPSTHSSPSTDIQ
jgi:hypothetical protein